MNADTELADGYTELETLQANLKVELERVKRIREYMTKLGEDHMIAFAKDIERDLAFMIERL